MNPSAFQYLATNRSINRLGGTMRLRFMKRADAIAYEEEWDSVLCACHHLRYPCANDLVKAHRKGRR